MYSIMHISDLHRSKEQPISNIELLASLMADSDSYIHENPAIQPPQAIVVSGDIVQGLPIGVSNYPSALNEQYQEAYDFLAHLTDEFLDGDRSRMIIVPGNHDVDWNAAYSAMEPVDITDDVFKLLMEPNTPFRWCWKTRSLFRITDFSLYEQRFRYFQEFYQRFYQAASLDIEIQPQRSWNLFSLDGGEIIICGFNSCDANDCFNLVGKIPAQAISESYLELRKQNIDRKLSIAVWHHDTQGPPQRSDYMDAETLSLLLGKGYRLGMHGHQHRSESLPYTLFVSESETIATACASSLCAGKTDLPMGSNRGYSILAIDKDQRSAKVHVREMLSPGVFSPARLTKTGGRTFFEVTWTESKRSAIVNTGIEGGTAVTILDNIERAMGEHNYTVALGYAMKNISFLRNNARPLLLEVLSKSMAWHELLQEIGRPRNPNELMQLFSACIATKNWDAAENGISLSLDDSVIPASLANDLRQRLKAERGSAI